MSERERAREWWTTAIVDIEPGVIRLRGYPVEDLIGRVSFAQTVWLMLRGELPTQAQATLLEAAMVAGVDHGPQAPSIAIARMAATCGVGLQSAMASGINVLGDVHGGAGEACLALLLSIDSRVSAEASGTAGDAIAKAVTLELDALGGAHVPGFGHRFHPVDPRAPRLTELLREAAARGDVSGRFVDIGETLEVQLAARAGKLIPMNVDGITAVVYAELGFPPPLARGLFVLSRSVGILAHAWEQTQQGGRIKGPLPPEFGYKYSGVPERRL